MATAPTGTKKPWFAAASHQGAFELKGRVNLSEGFDVQSDAAALIASVDRKASVRKLGRIVRAPLALTPATHRRLPCRVQAGGGGPQARPAKRRPANAKNIAVPALSIPLCWRERSNDVQKGHAR
jgi:hypothetical protein